MRRLCALLAQSVLAVPVLVLPVLPACTTETQDTSVMPYCEDTPAVIGFDDATDLGITAAGALANVPATEDVAFAWADGSTTTLTLGFTPGAEARYVTSEAVYPATDGPSPAIAVICEDRLEVDGTLSFATADGAFGERFASVVAATASAVTLYEALDLDALAGSFDIAPFVDAADYDTLSAWIDVSFSGGTSSGAVSGQASGQDDCAASSDDCAAWAERVDVASWATTADAAE
jgi:hypothetical protein